MTDEELRLGDDGRPALKVNWEAVKKMLPETVAANAPMMIDTRGLALILLGLIERVEQLEAERKP